MKLARIATAFAAVALVVGGLGQVATADPADDADKVLTQYEQLTHKSEILNEQTLAAREDFQKKVVAQRAATSTLTKAKATSARLVAERATLQVSIDKLVRANYQGARTNRLFALLVSSSPQQMLDQMSTLDVIGRDTVATVQKFNRVSAAAATAQRTAQTAATTATAAATAARTVQVNLQTKQSALLAEIARVKALYAQLTGAQRSALGGGAIPFNPRSIIGAGAPVAAVKAALTRVGDPYAWGATGPSQFDCSGLMVWSYQQVGVTLPRTSNAQLAGGQPVSRDALQPGDLIIYYPGATHVGMYVGDGYVVHASTYGVPVQVVPIDSAGPYNAARRY